jgi:hypothetical protein
MGKLPEETAVTICVQLNALSRVFRDENYKEEFALVTT